MKSTPNKSNYVLSAISIVESQLHALKEQAHVLNRQWNIECNGVSINMNYYIAIL